MRSVRYIGGGGGSYSQMQRQGIAKKGRETGLLAKSAYIETLNLIGFVSILTKPVITLSEVMSGVDLNSCCNPALIHMCKLRLI